MGAWNELVKTPPHTSARCATRGRFARRRFGQYDLIDVVVVLPAGACSQKPIAQTYPTLDCKDQEMLAPKAAGPGLSNAANQLAFVDLVVQFFLFPVLTLPEDVTTDPLVTTLQQIRGGIRSLSAAKLLEMQ